MILLSLPPPPSSSSSSRDRSHADTDTQHRHRHKHNHPNAMLVWCMWGVTLALGGTTVLVSPWNTNSNTNSNTHRNHHHGVLGFLSQSQSQASICTNGGRAARHPLDGIFGISSSRRKRSYPYLWMASTTSSSSSSSSSSVNRDVDDDDVLVEQPQTTQDEESLRVTATTTAATTTTTTTRQLHHWVHEQDPNWYQEYVLDILGPDHVQSNYPPLSEEETAQLATTPLLKDGSESESSSLASEQLVKASESNRTSSNNSNSNNNSVTLATTSATATIPIPIPASFEANEKNMDVARDVSPTTANEQIEDNNDDRNENPFLITTSNDSDSDCDNQANVVGDKDKSAHLPMEEDQDALVQEVLSIALNQMDDDDSDDTINPASQVEEGEEKEEKEPHSSDPVKEEEEDPPTNKQDEVIVSSSTTTSSTKTTTIERDTPKVLSSPSSTSSTVSPQETEPRTEKDARVVVYRDTKEGWKMVDLQVLTELGYRSEEVTTLQCDAVALIVQDKIQRPRMLGLPTPWKTMTTNKDDPDDQILEVGVQVVASATLGKTLQEEMTRKEQKTSRVRVPRKERSTPPKQEPVPSSTRDNGSTRRFAMPSKQKSERQSMDPRGKKENVQDAREPQGDSQKSVAIRADTPPSKIPATKPSISKHSEAPGVWNKAEMTDKKTGSPPPEDRAILFKKIGNTLGIVALANLTALGYQLDEIQALQSEALAVIVEDQVPRPRVGIPLQWKLSSEYGETSQIQVVDTIEQAEELIEAEKTQRRRKAAVDTEPIKSNPQQWQSMRESVEESRIRAKGISAPADDLSETRARSNPRRSRPDGRADIEVGNVSKGRSERSSRTKTTDRVDEKKPSRPSRASDASSQTRRKSDKSPRKRSEDDGTASKNRRSRDQANDNGSPKRIYNAREQLNPRKRVSKPDPPDPNSPLWMDMDTFRGLLRNEAELRLRILGDDWSPTVKQESEWRMNLYKDWLWTLHNGVGGSIVPPSRYERARQMKEEQYREEDEVVKPPSRPPPQKPRKRNRSPKN